MGITPSPGYDTNMPELPQEIKQQLLESINTKIGNINYKITSLRASGLPKLFQVVSEALGIGKGKEIKALKNEKELLTEYQIILSNSVKSPNERTPLSKGDLEPKIKEIKEALTSRVQSPLYKAAILEANLKMFGIESPPESTKLLNDVTTLKAQLKGLEILFENSSDKVVRFNLSPQRETQVEPENLGSRATDDEDAASMAEPDTGEFTESYDTDPSTIIIRSKNEDEDEDDYSSYLIGEIGDYLPETDLPTSSNQTNVVNKDSATASLSKQAILRSTTKEPTIEAGQSQEETGNTKDEASVDRISSVSMNDLEKLTPEKRIAVKKIISKAKETLLEEKKTNGLTTEQKEVLQSKLDKLNRLENSLLIVMKNNANKHLLNVMKGKTDASILYPGFTLKEMQDAILTANTAFLPTSELLGLIRNELMNSETSVDEKKQLISFLAEWCSRNLQTNEMEKNRSLIDSIINDIENIKNTDGTKIFEQEALNVQNALKTVEPTPAVVQRGGENFQRGVIDKLLADRFGTDHKYNEAVRTVSNDLFLMSLEDYSKLTPDDMFYPKWKKEGNESNPSSPAERKLVKTFNKTTDYIASLFIRYPAAEDRARLMKFFINVALELKENGHFPALLAVYAALTNTGVLKMQTAQNLLTGYEKELQELKEITDITGGFKNLFNFMEQRKGNYLPYLGATKPRILKTFEANPALDADKEVYNFKKYKLLKNEFDRFLIGQTTLKSRIEQPVQAKTSLELEIKSHKMLTDDDYDARLKDLRAQGKEFRKNE